MPVNPKLQLDTMGDPVHQIMKGLRRIAHALSIHSKHIQETYHITTPQLICLHELSRQGPMPLGTLTGPLYLNNSTVTGIVDRLEKSGLVHRTRISADRRQIHVEITRQGRAFVQKAPAPFQQHFLDRLAAIDQREIDQLLWAIDRLAEMLEPEAGRTDVAEDEPGDGSPLPTESG